MKAFLVAIVALAGLSAAAPLVLDEMGFSAADQAAGSSVRLGD
ncbi:MAG: hypothetical protein AAFU49_17495 [Pseudomonadota bacterium]